MIVFPACFTDVETEAWRIAQGVSKQMELRGKKHRFFTLGHIEESSPCVHHVRVASVAPTRAMPWEELPADSVIPFLPCVAHSFPTVRPYLSMDTARVSRGQD
jgi:hypothetical protein